MTVPIRKRAPLSRRVFDRGVRAAAPRTGLVLASLAAMAPPRRPASVALPTGTPEGECSSSPVPDRSDRRRSPVQSAHRRRRPRRARLRQPAQFAPTQPTGAAVETGKSSHGKPGGRNNSRNTAEVSRQAVPNGGATPALDLPRAPRLAGPIASRLRGPPAFAARRAIAHVRIHVAVPRPGLRISRTHCRTVSRSASPME